MCSNFLLPRRNWSLVTNRPTNSDEEQSAPAGALTGLLADWSRGDRDALDRLLPLLYDELHRIAASHLRRERPGHTLQPTALVHEAYLRLVGQHRGQWQNRAQFFAVSSQIMRRILVDHSRRRLADKRGGGLLTVLALDHEIDPAEGRAIDVVALDDALQALATIDLQQSRIIELRFFGGLNIDETAAVLDISAATVKRDWRMARAWLLKEMSPEP